MSGPSAATKYDERNEDLFPTRAIPRPRQEPFTCAYCGGSCDDRPFRVYAQCWPCWYRFDGRDLAVREWRARRRRWWRRFLP